MTNIHGVKVKLAKGKRKLRRIRPNTLKYKRIEEGMQELRIRLKEMQKAKPKAKRPFKKKRK